MCLWGLEVAKYLLKSIVLQTDEGFLKVLFRSLVQFEWGMERTSPILFALKDNWDKTTLSETTF